MLARVVFGSLLLPIYKPIYKFGFMFWVYVLFVACVSFSLFLGWGLPKLLNKQSNTRTAELDNTRRKGVGPRSWKERPSSALTSSSPSCSSVAAPSSGWDIGSQRLRSNNCRRYELHNATCGAQ